MTSNEIYQTRYSHFAMHEHFMLMICSIFERILEYSNEIYLCEKLFSPHRILSSILCNQKKFFYQYDKCHFRMSPMPMKLAANRSWAKFGCVGMCQLINLYLGFFSCVEFVSHATNLAQFHEPKRFCHSKCLQIYHFIQING